MNRYPPILWISIIIIFLLPSTVGRLIIDFAGGLLLFFILLPFLLGGLGWIGWKIIQSRMKTCNSCGASFLNEITQCPICGAKVDTNNNDNANIPASSVTIDITPDNSK